MSKSDRQLVKRLLAGEESAFDRFFDDNFPRLYRFALARLDRNEDAAEEIAQTTMCKAIAGLDTYRGEAALFTWLCTFCRHELSAYYARNSKSRRQVHLIEDHPEVRGALESRRVSDDGPSGRLDRVELARLVQVVLDGLPSRYGDALEWKYLDELPVKEIAVRLGVSPKAAESLLTRARAAFRDAFAAATRRFSTECTT